MGVTDDFLRKLDLLEEQLAEFGTIPPAVRETLHELREDLEAHQLGIDTGSGRQRPA
jgi:hypothetical protein